MRDLLVLWIDRDSMPDILCLSTRSLGEISSTVEGKRVVIQQAFSKHSCLSESMSSDRVTHDEDDEDDEKESAKRMHNSPVVTRR